MKYEFRDSSLLWVLLTTGSIAALYFLRAWIDGRGGAMAAIFIAYFCIASGAVLFMIRPPHWILIDELGKVVVIKNRFPHKTLAIEFSEIHSVMADVVRGQRSYVRLRLELPQKKTIELNFMPKNSGGFFSTLTPTMPEKVMALEEAIQSIIHRERK